MVFQSEDSAFVVRHKAAIVQSRAAEQSAGSAVKSGADAEGTEPGSAIVKALRRYVVPVPASLKGKVKFVVLKDHEGVRHSYGVRCILDTAGARNLLSGMEHNLTRTYVVC